VFDEGTFDSSFVLTHASQQKFFLLTSGPFFRSPLKFAMWWQFGAHTSFGV
jgi:hypothetical protein